MARSKTKHKKMRNWYIVGIGVFIIVILILMLLLHIFNRELISDSDVILYTEKDNIVINSSLPLNDKFGKTIVDKKSEYYKYVDFEIVNIKSDIRDYQIYVKKNDLGFNEIDGNYVKFYLTDDNDNPIGIFEKNKVPSFRDLNVIKDKPEGKLLYSGKIDSLKNKKFKLRVWIADNYVTNSEKVFSFDLFVRAK